MTWQAVDGRMYTKAERARCSGMTLFIADLPLAAAGPDSFTAEFRTTKGAFTMKARRAWAPVGSDRLYHLVKGGYFDGLVIYRVGETKSVKGGRVVQFGASGDTAVARAWEKTGIADEPVLRPHLRGSVNFARGGPATRPRAPRSRPRSAREPT